MNHIITFANQKGGVGKSTLAILFANYLCWKKMNVCIIDTDLQQTIAQMRKSDLDFYACEAPYSVQGFPVSDVDTMRQLMENARKFDGCVLIDAPGNLSQDGLIPILSETDFIVCPYRYDKATTASTSTFVKTILRMMREIRGMKPQLLFTPNNIYRKGNMEEKKVVIELQNVKRYFQVGSETVKALRGVSFKIYEGEFVTIQGTSGSGKSTLLNQLGCLDTPTSGEYFLDGISVRTMSKTQRAKLRNRKIGFVFQNYNLLPKTTALENVELPLMYNTEISADERHERAKNALRAVGLEDRMYHKSNQMSGGQMQRVAIARALVNDPAVLLADEATGNLDTHTSFEMLVLFQELYKQGHTIIFVTHNPEIAEYASRNINLRDGKIREDTINTNIKSAAEALAKLPVPQDD